MCEIVVKLWFSWLTTSPNHITSLPHGCFVYLTNIGYHITRLSINSHQCTFYSAYINCFHLLISWLSNIIKSLVANATLSHQISDLVIICFGWAQFSWENQTSDRVSIPNETVKSFVRALSVALTPSQRTLRTQPVTVVFYVVIFLLDSVNVLAVLILMWLFLRVQMICELWQHAFLSDWNLFVWNPEDSWWEIFYNESENLSSIQKMCDWLAKMFSYS